MVIKLVSTIPTMVFTPKANFSTPYAVEGSGSTNNFKTNINSSSNNCETNSNSSSNNFKTNISSNNFETNTSRSQFETNSEDADRVTNVSYTAITYF